METEKRKEPERIVDPDRYAEMSVPFDSGAAANDALKSFWHELYELRVKHGIANVSVIVRDSIKGTGQFFWTGHIGDPMQRESMAAWNLGQAAVDRQNMIASIIEEGGDDGIKRVKFRQ